MRTKLIILAVGTAAALCGFWAGSYHAGQRWKQIAERQFQSQNHAANSGRAAIAASVLRKLAEGRQSEARDALEMQLDLGVSGTLFYVSNYDRTGIDSIDAMLIDQARAYRSQHPWTNCLRPDLTETIGRAFKKAD